MSRSTPTPRGVRRRAADLLSAVAVGGLVVTVLSQLGGMGGLPEGTPAPPLEAALLDGAPVRPGGGVLVLNFWASWCGPCRAEAPALAALHARLEAEGAGRVVGLNVEGHAPARVREDAARLGMAYPIGRAGRPLMRAWNVERLPTTYVLSARGRVVRTVVGEARPSTLDAAVRAARAAR